MKCKKRQEFYGSEKNKKSIENLKDVYEKRMAFGKVLPNDFPTKRNEYLKCEPDVLNQNHRRKGLENEMEKFDDWDSRSSNFTEFQRRAKGIPRSFSDTLQIQRRNILKLTESDRPLQTANRISRKNNDNTLTVARLKQKFFLEENDIWKGHFVCFDYQSNFKEDLGKKSKSGADKDKIFRSIRSRSATIPRKWRERSLSTSDEVDDLPDGSCFRRTIHRPNLRRNLNRKSAALRKGNYIGSFPVSGSDQATRAEYVRKKLLQLRVLFAPLGEIKSFDDRAKLMERKSSFYKKNVAIKPVLLVISLSGIKVCSADGKSVHMAHALRRISYATCDPERTQFSFLAREPRGHFSLQYCHSFVTQTPEQAEELNSIVGNAFRMAYAAQLQRQPTFQEVIASQLQDSPGWQKNINTAEMNVKLQDPTSLRLLGDKDPPKSIPGLRSINCIDPPSNQSTPTSEESNSPTDLNSYKRLAEKPPLIKRLALGLTNSERTDDSRPLVTPAATSPVRRPLSGGYINEAVTDTESNKCCNESNIKQIKIDSSRLSQCAEQEAKIKRISQISSNSSGSGSCPNGTFRPPPPPERADSLTGRAEEGELRTAPWFQAGIPREITLEVLGQEPVGAFMVRESTSKPGCYALSLRVPRDFQPSGIAHYLIMRTIKGYKIKGFTKEFTTLTALITHHSVMPELLPCPLSLSRFNASFTQTDSSRDLVDTDSDPDYDTLADFRRMMADLNV